MACENTTIVRIMALRIYQAPNVPGEKGITPRKVGSSASCWKCVSTQETPWTAPSLFVCSYLMRFKNYLMWRIALSPDYFYILRLSSMKPLQLHFLNYSSSPVVPKKGTKFIFPHGKSTQPTQAMSLHLIASQFPEFSVDWHVINQLHSTNH